MKHGKGRPSGYATGGYFGSVVIHASLVSSRRWRRWLKASLSDDYEGVIMWDWFIWK